MAAKEWLENAKFDQVACAYLPGNVQVELRFYELYATGPNKSSPQKKVLDFLSSRQVKGQLYITGQSLGAALAVLNVLDIAKNTGHKSPVLYFFAGPRVGSIEYASVHDDAVSHSWRVVNKNDEVPKLPPKGTFGHHYRHVNMEFDITFGGKYPWDWGSDYLLDHYIKPLNKLKSQLHLWAIFASKYHR